MNYSDITGDWGERSLDFVEAAQSQEELLRLVRGWRERLGTKCGILDNYLAGVLNAMIDTTNTRDTAEKGFEGALCELRGVLKQIKYNKEDEAQKHPFYPKVKAYMDAHPFPRDLLYYETYCVGLFREYITFSVNNYMDRCNEKFQIALKENNVPQLRAALLSSKADITDEVLDYLNNLISRVCIWIAPSSVFIQGMTDQILFSLISRDKDSSQYVLQRIFDGEI